MEKVYNLVEFDKVAEFLSECAISELGRLRCLNLIVFDDAQTIKKELVLTTQAKNVLNQALNLPIETIKDIQKSLDDAKKQLRLSETEIYDIADVIRTSRLVKLFLGRLSLDFFELSELKNPLFSNKELEDKIFNIFDNTLKIKNDASIELKRLNLALRDNLSNVKKTISKLLSDTTFSSYLQDNLYTEREGRTVFQVKAECKNKVAGIVHDISATSQTYFIEPRELVGLNNKIREIEILIDAEIEKILKALSVEISKFYYEISGSFKQLIEIDFVFAKAKYSIKTDSCAAEISDYKKISLKAMKNPVLMRVKENIIENDFYLEKENNCLIITGSNTGGKTVILKTVGLFILMAKAGLHIPCYEANIYPFKKIFADIGDEQSIIQSLSTFSSHMTNIVKILEQSDGETIVLLDEISAGTDPSEGASLAQAILEYLQEKGTFCIATTHYGELKSLAYLHKGFVNASVEFDLNTLSPTYKLLTGIPGSSNAIAIAGNLGINDEIARKARDIYFNKKGTDAKVLEELQLAQQQLSESAKSAQNAEYEVKQLEEELKQKLNELKKEKKKNINIYKKKYESLIESAKDEVKEILKEIREEKSEKIARRSFARLSEEENKLREEFSYDELNLASKYQEIDWTKTKEGDLVLIKDLNQKAQIVAMPDKNKNVSVQIGLIKTKVKQNKLAVYDKSLIKEPPVKKFGYGKTFTISRHDLSNTLDLRGYRCEEALDTVENYLDKASLANLTPVYIIHGHGTGALKQVVRDYLENSPYVAKYRPGEPAEGGDGVSVIDIN